MDSRTRLAVAHTHGRLAVRTRDAPLPWGSGACTSSGSTLTSVGQCPGTRPTMCGEHEWMSRVSQRIRGVGLALVPAQMRSVHEYMGSAGRSASARLRTPVLAHMDVDEPGRSVRVPAPDTKCNFYIEFYE